MIFDNSMFDYKFAMLAIMILFNPSKMKKVGSKNMSHRCDTWDMLEVLSFLAFNKVLRLQLISRSLVKPSTKFDLFL